VFVFVFAFPSAGVLSLTTCSLNVAGNIIRTFTNLTLTHDKLLLLGCCTQGVLNTILLCQVVHTRLMRAQEPTKPGVPLGTFDEGDATAVGQSPPPEVPPSVQQRMGIAHS
jgi:hypothetical protein